MKKTIIILVALVVAVGLATWLLTRQPSGGRTGTTAGKPSYQTVLPAGKSIRELGGWKRVSPPEKEPVFAYADTIDGVAISVSQQPLPASFKGDAENQVADLAKKFNATHKIDGGSTSIYVGTSAKGPQSVIFTKDSTLILIKSEKNVKDASWAAYAKTLR